MNILNPIEMNDWEIGKFLKLILSIQLAMLGAIGLDAMGFQIPIIRQLIGFIYLTFVPGILILRVLKLHKLGSIETLLYTVGMSIATLMFTGFFMNTTYPFFGVSESISLVPLVITISIVVLMLCVLCYIIDKDFSDPSYIDVRDVLSPPVMFLCLIPFLAIFGTYLMNFYHNNTLLMLLIIILAIIIVSVGFNKFFPKNLYPLVIFIITISLLYHRSLISMYLWGSDIHLEHHLSNVVMWDSHWDSTIPMAGNAMLSITMLAPIYSIITNMDITWIFKIIYPFLFSLVLLGSYQVFRKQTNEKIAILSCLFLMSTNSFYGILLEAARQQIAELFFVLLILLTVDKSIDRVKKAPLSIVFAISLIVSHYGVSYIFMFSLIGVWLILVLMNTSAIRKLGGDFYDKYDEYGSEKLAGNPNLLKMEDRTISSTFVLLFVVFALAWYMYISCSVTFDAIIHIGDHIITNISDTLNPTAVEGLYIITAEFSRSRTITKYLYLITQFFISVGILTLLLKPSELTFKREYSVFSLIYFIMLLASLFIPYISAKMSTARTYHLALLFLAPFCMIGYVTICKVLGRVIKIPWTNKTMKSSSKILSIFLATYLLFNAGLVCEVIKDEPPQSISLNSTIKHPRCFSDGEVCGTQWLAAMVGNERVIYADYFGKVMLYGFVYDINKVGTFNNETKYIIPDSYVFMGRLNLKEDIIGIIYWGKPFIPLFEYPKLYNSTFYSMVIMRADKIYDSGDAQTYHSR